VGDIKLKSGMVLCMQYKGDDQVKLHTSLGTLPSPDLGPESISQPLTAICTQHRETLHTMHSKEQGVAAHAGQGQGRDGACNYICIQCICATAQAANMVSTHDEMRYHMGHLGDPHAHQQ